MMVRVMMLAMMTTITTIIIKLRMIAQMIPRTES